MNGIEPSTWGHGDMLNVTDIMPSALRFIAGTDQSFHNLSMGAARQVVVWLVDGWGYDQVLTALEKHLMPHLSELMLHGAARLHSLLSVFPSVTPVVLASVLTGKYPSAHGVLGQVVKHAGGIVDVMRGPVPNTFHLLVDDIATQALQAGISYHAVVEHRLRKDSLTMLLHRNVSHIETFVVASGLPTVVNEILDRNEPGIIYVYWSGVDVLNHERGAYGLEWEAEMTSMDQWIAAFTQSARNRAWLWITADHGHIPIAGRLRYYDLRRTLSWLPEIPTQIGPAIAVDMELPANFSSIVNNWASVPIDMVRTKDWWDKGYFGPGADIQHMERIGSYLLIPPAGWQWQITDEPQHPWGHGGTTQPEMTVPWIEVSLEGRRYVC